MQIKKSKWGPPSRATIWCTLKGRRWRVDKWMMRCALHPIIAFGFFCETTGISEFHGFGLHSRSPEFIFILFFYS